MCCLLGYTWVCSGKTPGSVLLAVLWNSIKFQETNGVSHVQGCVLLTVVSLCFPLYKSILKYTYCIHSQRK